LQPGGQGFESPPLHRRNSLTRRRVWGEPPLTARALRYDLRYGGLQDSYTTHSESRMASTHAGVMALNA